MFDCSLDFSTLSLTANDLFAEMGYGNTAPEEPVEALALSMLKEVSSRTVPRCTFGLFDGTVDDGYVTLDGGEPFPVGGTIASLLKGSERFALFAATAGMAFQEYQDSLKAEGDILKCFIADIIGPALPRKPAIGWNACLKKNWEANGIRTA